MSALFLSPASLCCLPRYTCTRTPNRSVCLFADLEIHEYRLVVCSVIENVSYEACTDKDQHGSGGLLYYYLLPVFMCVLEQEMRRAYWGALNNVFHWLGASAQMEMYVFGLFSF